MRFAWVAAAAFLAAGPSHAGCLADPEPCQIEGGSYRISLPEGGEGAVPAMMFLHGAGSSGRAMIDNMGLAKTANARGYAFIAPDGSARPGRRGFGWSFHPLREELRDERAFVAAVKADAAARFGIDPDAVMLGGFSIGGSMVSYIACAGPRDFAAFAPVAGSFWRPHPEMEACAGPVRLLHAHGWRDGTVPLEGRNIASFNITQGDVFYAMQIWRATNGCSNHKADGYAETGQFWRRWWTACTPGSALEFALFPGGHGVPKGWADLALDWFESLDDSPN